MNMFYFEIDRNKLAARWWLLVLRGVAALAFGVTAIVWPAISLLALTLLWGAYALADGVLGVALAARVGRAGQRWGWLLAEGILSLAVGVITFVWPGLTALALLTLIAVWAVFTGVLEIAAAIELRRVIRGEWLLALSGVLSIAFGVLALIFPQAGTLAVLGFIAAYSIVFGALMIVLGVRLRLPASSSERQAPTPGDGVPSHA